MTIYCRVKTAEQLQAVRGLCDVIICGFDAAAHETPVGSEKMIADLPDISREMRCSDLEKQFNEMMKYGGVVVHTLDELGFLKSSGYDGEILADPFLYAYNDEAVSFYRNIFPRIRFIAPDELTDEELESLGTRDELIYRAYGRQRVMFTAQDAVSYYSSNEKPGRTGGQLDFRSVRGDSYIAVREPFGYTTFYTKKPVNMLDRAGDIRMQNILIDLTTESRAELDQVIKEIRSFLRGGKEDTAAGNPSAYREKYRGHHYKGID